MIEAVEKKMQQKMDSKKKKNDSPDFHKGREIKTRQDHLLFILIVLYIRPDFQLLIEPNNLQLSYASVPKRKKKVQHNNHRALVMCLHYTNLNIKSGFLNHKCI